MAALERIPPQLEAPASPEAPEAAETVEDEPERAHSPGPMPQALRRAHRGRGGGGG